MRDRQTVSSADFIRNIGYWQNEALRQPLSITHHGRERLVLAAPSEFAGQGPSDGGADSEIAALKAGGAALLEHMEEGFLAFDAGLRIVGANGVAEAFTGRDRASLMGAAAIDSMPDPIGPLLSDRLGRVLRTRRPESLECSAFDGRWLSLRIFPTPAGAAALFHNTTEQHMLRREREGAAALERAAREHGAIASVRLDARGRIEEVGGAFTHWTGFAPGDVAGHRFADLTAGQGRRDLAGALERVLRDLAALHLELTLLGKRGEEIEAQLCLAPVTSDFVARGAQALITRAAPALAHAVA